MTVSSTTNRAAYTGNGVTTSFSFPYYFLADSDLKVIKVTIADGTESVQVLNTDYTVTGAANPAGGSVVMASAPSSSYSIVIYRDPPATQAVDLVENDPLPAETLEGAYDKLTMLIQRVKDVLGRSLRQPEGDATDIAVLPAKATRASKYLAFDADGNAVATAGTTSSAVISTFAETILDDTSAGAVRTTIGAQQDVITTRGDIVKGSSSGVAERLAVGGANTVLTSNGTDPSWQDWRTPRGYIDGFILSNNGSDATNDIDIGAGICRDSADTATIVLASAVTKQLDASWAVGTNAGGLDTGSKAANTWYAVWAIRRPDTGVVDALFSTSFSAPTMPANYTQKRLLGAVRTNNSNALYAFTQAGDRCYWKAPTLDVSSTGFSAASTAITFTLSGTSTQGSPPVEGTLVALNLSIYPNAGSGRGIYVYHPSDTGSLASATSAPLASLNSTGSTNKTGGEVTVRSNASGQIAMRPDDTLANVYAAVIWFTMPRGKDA